MAETSFEVLILLSDLCREDQPARLSSDQRNLQSPNPRLIACEESHETPHVSFESYLQTKSDVRPKKRKQDFRIHDLSSTIQKDPSTGGESKIRAQHTIEDRVWCQCFDGTQRRFALGLMNVLGQGQNHHAVAGGCAAF